MRQAAEVEELLRILESVDPCKPDPTAIRWALTVLGDLLSQVPDQGGGYVRKEGVGVA